MDLLKYILLPLLYPFSLLYLTIVKIRHFLYDCNIKEAVKVDAFVISVGNISVGGTGKTPLVMELCRSLQTIGAKCAVVTRGYKRKSQGLYVVSDGETISPDVDKSGDEPYLIASNVAVPVICDADRVEGASYAIKNFGSEYIILDDGFQHRKIGRDFDIVVIDSPRFLGNGLMLPAGILRDTVARLEDCNLIVISKISDRTVLQEQLDYLQKFDKKIVYSTFSGRYIKNIREQIEVKALAGKRVYLFCGIGSPRVFFESFTTSEIVKKKAYADHHGYSEEELKNMVAEAGELASDYLITTEKDYVKIPDKIKKSSSIYYLKLESDFLDLEFNPVDISGLII